MSKKILVNGVFVIIVREEQYSEFVGLLPGGACEDLDDFDVNSRHEQYDFDKFLEKAEEYSNKNPPDVVQFSEKAWGAASIWVKVYFLKYYGILLKSHLAKSNLLVAILRVGLSNADSRDVEEGWNQAQSSHSNFYEMKFFTKTRRNEILKKIRKMATTMEEADRYRIGEAEE